MIIYYWGKDYERSRRAARAELVTQRNMSPSSPVFELVGDSVSLENLEEILYTRPLIGDKVIVFGDHLLINLMMANFVTENLSVFQSSENVFIFWEDEAGEKLATVAVKAGGLVREFKIAASVKPRNDYAAAAPLFAVADALGDKDRKRAWLLYHEAHRVGLPTEEIFWKLVWKVKTLLLVETVPAGSVLPIKPYPLSQAKRQVKNYKSGLVRAGTAEGELARLSSRLVHLYHDSRRGLIDFDFGLERLLLEL